MDGMDEQTRSHESQNPENDPYYSYTGQKVYCPHCTLYVKIMSKVGMQDSDPASHNPYEVFKTSCQHEAIGEFSSKDAEWNFWIIMNEMDEQTRSHESQNPENDPYLSYIGQEVFCPHCYKDVSIVSKTRYLEGENSHIAEFKTSCKHEAYGYWSDGQYEERFWID